MAAAPQGTSPTPISVASTCLASTDTTTTPTSATARRRSHRRTPAPAAGSPDAKAALTSRATVVWTAEPSTMRMMNVEISADSDP